MTSSVLIDLSSLALCTAVTPLLAALSRVLALVVQARRDTALYIYRRL